ncbi:phosphatase PAP2 family protein [Acetobacter orleanensis]|uniref:phosphatase PAP2 family protein n=1 Tax=Acetobacter orleanensis TaxID=104099 RepID=UPI000AB1A27C|nr:phosphatase PAP2 family protein [Acetobacter orleanensis]PCD79003.1 phosphoesterase [Acetobacter orleanensis]
MKTNKMKICLSLCFGLCVGVIPLAQGAEHHFQYLQPTDVQSSLLLPAPLDDNSPGTKSELIDLHTLINASSPERLAQAKVDNDHEDPSLFDGILGFKLKNFPKTWSLLKMVQNEGDASADVFKEHFHRKRPWAVDPSMPRCDGSSTAHPYRSYPSGHSTLSYSTGYILARLLPGQSQTILDRASDYAESRKVCGVHYPSDTEASHVLGTYVATRLMANPRFLQQFAAARDELKEAHVKGS